jgi:transcription elongation GreA/GreB family factor
VGRALIGKALGETVTVVVQDRTRELTIAEIDYV